MAKHLVKCLYCGKTFDANVESFVKINAKRYAHKECAEEAERKKTKEEKDLDELREYIKNLFGISCISPKINKQIQTFHEKNGFSYSGIRKSLYYFYEVKGNSLEKANNGIGIVGWIYDEAKEYWRNLSEIRESNKDVQVVMPTMEIHISSPKREPMKHMRKLFTFLDEEGRD